MTKEMRPELDQDIPTILLRLQNLEYHKNQMAVMGSGDKDKGSTSDIQAILDGKLFDIAEISVHLMKATHLQPDEFFRGKKHPPAYFPTL